MKKLILLLACCFGLFIAPANAQKKKKDDEPKTEKSLFEKTSFSGLKFRSIGPALTSGRISDIAMVPGKSKEYYVATSAGGVWKTSNAGTTFKPIFDSQGSYSIGCVTIDPNNNETIWIGTGENNNQRSVSYGDGIYVSYDGGETWKHKGLKESEHIGKIIVHPDNSNVIFVAAIGPVWSSGGERGVYKSIDGGDTWKAVLTISEHTGVNDIVMDLLNPDILVASAFQRQRHVFTYLGGGPESDIYRSTDGGETWQKSSTGMPGGDKGRIGFATTPADPNLIYAIAEIADGKSGLYASTNRGISWSKRGGYVSSGNYYQEIVADPINPAVLYGMNTWLQVSIDGGKSFSNAGEDAKHVDNHSMWIDDIDTEHWIVGCDGGIYETWDAAKTWHFKANLPVTQFYKVAVDNDEPFYNIYGGTQDNFSLGGPSRTISGNGIANDEWYITHGGDGFESQVDPENPNIVYAQSQYGFLVRFDRQSGEELGIKPQPARGENQFRWNWDAPLQVSAHVPGRLYFAANKVFRSDDKGNSWETISDDLTRQLNRNELEIMDRVWGIDAVNKNLSTSPYGTIVALSESPIDANMLAIGTDDGLIQITNDGGKTWQKIDGIAGVPNRSYVNALLHSQHDANVIYACFNHHKYGDFKPYLFKSSDKGQTWRQLSNNLPDRGSLYTLAEDHVDQNLLFAGTEFGVFFTIDGGLEWKQLKAGVPTIAVRDIAIQQRENDLVLGTFGRGFYVLDDYSSLRSISNSELEKEAEIFAVRDALSFETSYPYGLPGKSFQGDSWYQGENLGSEAVFTYYVKEKMKTLKDQRQEKEKEMAENNGDVMYPSFEQLQDEDLEEAPKLVFTIADSDGNIIRKLTTGPKEGINRIHWDLRYPPKDPISLGGPGFYNPFAGKTEGALVAPGTYRITMSQWKDAELMKLAGPINFNVKALKNRTLPAADENALAEFQRDVARIQGTIQGTQRLMGGIGTEMKHIRKAIDLLEVPGDQLLGKVIEIEKELRSIREKLSGERISSRLDIDRPQSISSKISTVSYEGKYSRSAPTETHRRLYKEVMEDFPPVLDQLRSVVNGSLQQLRSELQKAGAPYTPNALPEVIFN